MRYGINLGSLTAAEEKEYWYAFGLRLQAFLALAEPVAIEMYSRSFANLSQSEQAEVIRRVPVIGTRGKIYSRSRACLSQRRLHGRIERAEEP